MSIIVHISLPYKRGWLGTNSLVPVLSKVRIQNNQNIDAKHQIVCVSCLTRAAFDLIGLDFLSDI